MNHLDPAKFAGIKSPETRRKFYAITLLVCILSIAGIGLLAVWVPDILNSTTYKLFITLGIIAFLSVFLYLFSFGQTDKKSRALIYTSCGAAIALSALFIAQIWLDLLAEPVFVKLCFSLVIIGGIASGLMVLWDDFFESKELKEKNYLD